VDSGKVRVFSCVCGAEHVLRLDLSPDGRVCGQCGVAYGSLPSRVEDHRLFVYKLLAGHGHEGARRWLDSGEPLP
jgi:hypothetical protein